MFKLPFEEPRRAAPAAPRRRCACYGCRLADGMGGPAAVAPALTRRAAELNARLLQVIAESDDAEPMVDEVLGLALGAFDAGEMTEDQFRDLSAQCLDALTFLAR